VVKIHTTIAAAAAVLALVAPAAGNAARAQHHYVLPLAVSSPSNCTLTVATARFWTYSCPTVSGSLVRGVSRGAIPSSCKVKSVTGYRWSFSCPSSALLGPNAALRGAATGQAIDRSSLPQGCARPPGDRILQRVSCIL
jgi:hypothetical protein